MAYIISQRDLATTDERASGLNEFEFDADEKLPVALLVKKRLENVVPLIKQQEKQIAEFWEVLVRLKKEVKTSVTRDELERQMADWAETAQNAVAFDVQA